MKIVIDVNVYVSWILFSKPRSTIDSVCWFAYKSHSVYLSGDLLSELRNTLMNKFGRDDQYANEVEDGLLEKGKVITPLGIPPPLCRDPKDDYLLHLSRFVQADFLITGDKDLLVLDPFGNTRIVYPTQAAEMWGLN